MTIKPLFQGFAARGSLGTDLKLIKMLKIVTLLMKHESSYYSYILRIAHQPC